MKEKPICVIEGCNNVAFVLFGNNWICGECLVKYDRKLKEENFKRLQEVIGE